MAYGLLWSLMGSYGLLWAPMGSYGLLWPLTRAVSSMAAMGMGMARLK
jgi:hypothetical protein